LIRDLCCCVWALFFFVLGLPAACAQGTAPTFSHTVGRQAYTLLGQDPAQAVSTTIPTVLVPLELSFAPKARNGKPFVMAAAPDVRRILSSPIFSRFAFSSGNNTQYGDALLRTTFPVEPGWHTLLGKPEVKPLKIDVPLGYGYILTSKKEGTSFAVVDVEFLQQAIFKQLPRQEGKLILAVTHKT
jgi:chitinase